MLKDRKMDRLDAFGRARDGNIAIIFAFTFSLLMLFAGGAVDFARYNTVRADLIESMDAAGLAIAQLDAMNGPEIRDLTGSARTDYLKQYGRDFFHQNFRHESEINGLSVDFKITNTKITPQAQGSMKTMLLGTAFQLLNIQSGAFRDITMTTNTEITRAATGNTETALVLDITGSMNSEGRIDDLITAANEFVDVLVRKDQTQYYSKVAIVPYSMGVNVDTRAASARGGVAGATTITGITKAKPAVVTAPNHGFQNGDYIYIKNVGGMYQLAEGLYRTANVSTNSFQLKTSSNGNTDTRSYSTYTGGGKAYCTNTGCQYKTFVNQNGSRKVFEASTCVSERTGANKYNDTYAGSDHVGYVYTGTSNVCPGSKIMPLTTDTNALKASINALVAEGSTAAQIGIAWGWYMVSPNFAPMFTGDSAPALYTDDVAKTVVIMTDGNFNTVYCDGVISQSSTSGSGSSSDKINCNTPNGDPFGQATSVCTAMKLAGVTVYTVGFKIGNDQNAKDVMQNCASGTSNAYLAEDGAALKRVFADIAQNIAQLHVSK